MQEFDYIVVGAGSAGCVLARRLSEQPDISVALVEAGPREEPWTVRMPAAVSINIKGSRYNWGYRTEPQGELGARTLYQPRGRVLGGSSVINGMIFIRGHALDFDGWERQGATGWSYRHVLPYFRKLEDFEGDADLYRGKGGPIPVMRGQSSNPLHDAFLAAGQEAGHAFTRDVNGFRQSGVSYFDKNISGGERWSAARGYLSNASDEVRGRLTIVPDAMADKIEFEGRRAAILTTIQGGAIVRLRARQEIILAAGTFGSPAILMRSGVGPADQLAALSIPVVADIPAVGRNLQDHTEVHIQYACTQPITLYGDLKPLRRAFIGARWFLTRSGKGATNHYDTGAFLSTDTTVAHPDVQLHFVPIVYNNSVERKVVSHGFRVHAGPLRPASRGFLTLRSADPTMMPLIQPNYMTEPRDWDDMRRIIALSREIFAQAAFGPYRGREMSPGATVRGRAETDQFLREWVDTGYHPAGTCRMGKDANAVVAPEGQVYGIEGVRVCDASIMPTIVSGNLNASVMMMAERMSDLILGRAMLEPIDAPHFEQMNGREVVLSA
jgi:choline dehydrogenase